MAIGLVLKSLMIVRNKYMNMEIGRDFYKGFMESNAILERFRNLDISSKIRKIDLMKACEFPLPKTEYFDIEDRSGLLDSITRKIEGGIDALIVRVACVPDKKSMPCFCIESEGDIEHAFEGIDSLMGRDQAVTSFILQEAIPDRYKNDKISGRIVFETSDGSSLEQIMEIYKGAKGTGILNDLDVRDKNYRRFEKKFGGIIKLASSIDEQSDIQELEVQGISEFIKNNEIKMLKVRDIFARSKDKKANETPICFEFSYFRGDIVFTDFD